MQKINKKYSRRGSGLPLTLLLILFLGCLTNSIAQTKLMKGKILHAETKEILQGATISYPNGTHAVQSKRDGSFEISIPDTTSLLQVTHVGFSSQLENLRGLASDGNITILLRPSNSQLDEVVVSTGYQTLPQERSTGSFSVIDNKTLNLRASTSILKRLEGMATGLLFSPEPAPPVTIRGINSLLSANEPLIVVDNFPYQGDINNINPNDVVSVTLLKDAAAASIWGAKAGNGVIVITTKKGKLNQPLRISLTANGTYLAKPNVYTVPILASGDFIGVEKMLFDNGYYTALEADPYHQPFTPVVELLIAERDGQIDAATVDKKLAAYSKLNVLDDYNRYWYQPGYNQQYSLSLQGGGPQAAWMFSFGYDNNKSNLDDRLERFTLRMNNLYRPFKNVELTTELLGTQQSLLEGRQPYEKSRNINNSQKSLYPYADLVDENGNALPIVNMFRSTYVDTAGGGKLLDWKYYPYAENQYNKKQTRSVDLLANLALRYKLTNWIQLEARYQFEKQQSSTDFDQSTDAYFTKNMINSYAQQDINGNFSFPVPMGNILDETENSIQSNSFRFQADLSNSWGKHSVYGLAGYEAGLVEIRTSYYRTFGYNPENNFFTPVDLKTLFPQYYSPTLSLPIFDNRNLTGTNQGRQAYYLNASYEYDKRYLLTLSARKDQSNLFGSNTNERTVPLWSAGLSWNLLNESFIKIPSLSVLKFRFTYGYNGNMNPTASATTVISFTPGRGQSPPYASVSRYPNPELRWEKVRNLNIGLDFSLTNGSLSGKLELFRKKITDMTTGYPVDYTTGTVSITKNIATMYGQGIELELSSQIGKGAFRYQPTLLLSYVSNKISDSYLSNSQIAGLYFYGSGLTAIPGKSPYSVLSYASAGLNPTNGNPRGYLKGKESEDYSGIINQTDIDEGVYHGSSIPTVFGSFRNLVTFKNISLSFQLQYKGAYYFRRSTLAYGALYGAWVGHADFALRWQKPGDEAYTTVPSMQYPLSSSLRDRFYANSTATIEKGDHIRLQDISLSWDMSRSVWGKLSSLQFYTKANNLGIIWRANKRNIDPDYARTIPPAYNISFGIKANF